MNTRFEIHGWEKLYGVHSIDWITVDVLSVAKMPSNESHIYEMVFTIYHVSKGTSPNVVLRINPCPNTVKCEILVKENSTIIYQNWVDINNERWIFQTPMVFLRWVIHTINKQHRYFSSGIS